MIENEAKFRLDDRSTVLKRLRRLKAVPGRRQREEDYAYDTPDRRFARQGKLIRLRTSGRSCLLTFKGPLIPGRFKKRYEVNLACAVGAAKAAAALRSMGLAGRFAKEKLRQQWQWGKTLVCLDTLPLLGDFVEIEGSSSRITATAKALGLDPRQAIKDSYETLFGRLCAGLSQRCPECGRQAQFSFAFERKARKKKWL